MFRFIQDFLIKMGQKNKHNVEKKYLIKYKSLIQPEVFKALLEGYAFGDIVFEPIRNKLSETEVDNLYLRIDKANFLSHQEKFETIVALMYLIDGSFPESEVILGHLKKIF